jgi:hypothetical protein
MNNNRHINTLFLSRLVAFFVIILLQDYETSVQQEWWRYRRANAPPAANTESPTEANERAAT